MQKPRFNLSRGFSVSAKNDKRGINRVKDDADRALRAPDPFVLQGENINGNRHCREQPDVGEKLALHRERSDDARDSEDEKDIEKAGADGVSDRDSVLTLPCRGE